MSGKLPGTNKEEGYAIPSLSGNYSQNSADSKWVSNQTSIIAENGGSIKVEETLTNKAGIIGSLSEENKLSIEANKVVIENLKDHDQGENSGIQVSGISKDTLIPQTGIQYGSHDKQQDSNATFVNTEVTEAGKKLNLEELGINTDINKAQVITKDEVVEQIDTVLHIDLGNQKVRDQFVEDILKTGSLIPEVIQGIKEGTASDGQSVAGQIANNLIENKDNIHTFVTDRENKQREKNQELLDKNNGKLSQELLDETTKFIKETLDAAGKGDYTVVYSEGGNDPAMSINDSKKIIVVNVDKTDFTDTESIRRNTQHEGVHNRYVDKGIDESAAESIYSGRDKSVDNKIPDSLKEQLTDGKELYDEGVLNGEFRDKRYVNILELKNDRYKNYTGEELDKKIISDYGLNEGEYYKLARELKEGGNISKTDWALLIVGLIPGAPSKISTVVDIVQKQLRGYGTDERSAYLVALTIENLRSEKATEISTWNINFAYNIAVLGAKNPKEAEEIKMYFFDPQTKYENMHKKAILDNLWIKGIEKYNAKPGVNPISRNNLIEMKNDHVNYMRNFDPDIYLKPYTFERTW